MHDWGGEYMYDKGLGTTVGVASEFPQLVKSWLALSFKNCTIWSFGVIIILWSWCLQASAVKPNSRK